MPRDDVRSSVFLAHLHPLKEMRMRRRSVPAALFFMFSTLLSRSHGQTAPDLTWMRAGSRDTSWWFSASYSPDGKYFACADRHGTAVRLFRTPDGVMARTITHVGLGAAVDAVFSPDSRVLACSYQAGIFFHSVPDGAQLTSIPGSFGRIAYDPSGRAVAACAGNTVQIRDVKTGQVVFTLAGHSDTVRAVAYSHGGTMIGTCSN